MTHSAVANSQAAKFVSHQGINISPSHIQQQHSASFSVLLQKAVLGGRKHFFSFECIFSAWWIKGSAALWLPMATLFVLEERMTHFCLTPREVHILFMSYKSGDANSSRCYAPRRTSPWWRFSRASSTTSAEPTGTPTAILLVWPLRPLLWGVHIRAEVSTFAFLWREHLQFQRHLILITW